MIVEVYWCDSSALLILLYKEYHSPKCMRAIEKKKYDRSGTVFISVPCLIGLYLRLMLSISSERHFIASMHSQGFLNGAD